MNTCQCPNPPGGVANCGSGQMALCHIENGVAVTTCLDPPPSSRTVYETLLTPGGRVPKGRRTVVSNLDAVALFAWNQITGSELPPGSGLTPAQLKVLRSGVFQREDGTDVTFTLPPELAASLAPAKKRTRRRPAK